MRNARQTAGIIFPLWMKITLLCVFISFVAGGIWFFRDQKTSQRKSVETNLWAVANLKSRQISQWRAERIADATVIAGRRALVASIQHYLAGATPHESDQTLRRLRIIKEQYHLADVFVVDRQKRTRLTLDPNTMGAYQEHLSVLDSAISGRRPIWTSFHVEPEVPYPHLSIVTPLFLDDRDQTAVGALVLVCDASQFLFPLVQSWPTPSHTAETLLVAKDGDSVIFLNELRHKKQTALKLRIPLSRTDLPAAMAVSGQKGIVQGIDYRGEKVVAAILPVRETPWFIVAKMDAVEAYAEWYFRSAMILIFFFCGIGLIAAIGFLLAQRNLKAHYKVLYNSELELSRVLNRHKITLKAIGDAVISTDSRGHIEFMNPVAEHLTGWKREAALGKKLTDVFRIISEATREPMEDPAAKVMRAGTVVGLANHTLLVAKDGREIPIADSGSPIRDERGNIIGVVLVFNDQSEERGYQKKLVESEERYRLLADNTLDVIWIMNMELVFTYVNPAIKHMTGYEPEEWVGTRLYEHCEEAPLSRMTEVMAREIEKGKAHNGVVMEMPLLKKDGTPLVVEIHGKIIFDENGKPSGLQGTALDITERLESEKAYRDLQAQLAHSQKMESVGRLAGGVAHDYNNMLSIIMGYSELALERLTPAETIYDYLREIFAAAKRSTDITRQLLAFASRQTITPKVLDVNAVLESMLNMLRRLIGEDIDLAWIPGNGLWPVKMDPSQIDQILANLCVNARDAIDSIGKVTIETNNVTFDEEYCAEHAGFLPGRYAMLAVSDNGKGMDKETLEKAFEPFFTTKGVGEGTGLGLAMVYGIVKQNNGFINIYSEPEKGTTIKIYLPRIMEKEEKVLPSTDKEIPVSQGETVLLVEDEASILNVCRKMLEELGYAVVVARTPEEAIRAAEAHSSEIMILMTDVIMPEMNGRDLAGKLQSWYPDLKVLYMSGYTANVIAHHGVLDEGVCFLQKPFSKKEMAIKLRESMAGAWDSISEAD